MGSSELTVQERGRHHRTRTKSVTMAVKLVALLFMVIGLSVKTTFTARVPVPVVVSSQDSIARVVSSHGSISRLPCPLSPGEAPIVWQKDSRLLFAGNVRVRQDNRLTVEQSSVSNVLLVQEVEAEDGGQYRCEMEVEGGEVRVGQVELVVHTPPTAHILGVGQVVTVREGTQLALTCRGHGVPVPMVSWHKRDGQKTSLLARDKSEVGLIMSSVSWKDSGELVCRADNGVGEIGEDVLLLDVLTPPKVRLLPASLSLSGDSARHTDGDCGLQLQCMILSGSSSSEAHVSWYRDGNILLLPSQPEVTMWSLDNLHVLQLHICDLSILGNFLCRAQTTIGIDEASVEVTNDWDQEMARREEQEIETDNNVRREVGQQGQPQPLVSMQASSSNLFLKSGLIFVIVTFTVLDYV